jgi:hypothetical protein
LKFPQVEGGGRVGKEGGKGGGEGAMSIGLWGMRESRRRRIKNSLFTHNSSTQIFPYKSPQEVLGKDEGRGSVGLGREWQRGDWDRDGR